MHFDAKFSKTPILDKTLRSSLSADSELQFVNTSQGIPVGTYLGQIFDPRVSIAKAGTIYSNINAYKGTSKDGNTKFIRIFAQVGVLFKGDDNKFTGNINAPEIGSSKKNLIGWLNDKSEKPNIAGYQNDPQDKPQQEQQQQPKDDALSF